MFASSSLTVNARAAFAKEVQRAIDARGKDVRFVAKACWVKADEVQRWRDGVAVPNDLQWKRFVETFWEFIGRSHAGNPRTRCDLVTRLRDAAIAEREAEHQQRKEAREVEAKQQSIKIAEEPMTETDDGVTPRVRRALADLEPGAAVNSAWVAERIGASIDATTKGLAWLERRDEIRRDGECYVVVKLSKIDPRTGKVEVRLPPGSKSKAAAAERATFARGLFMQRPYMPNGGRDGMHQALRDRFGISLNGETLDAIRNEVLASQGRPAVDVQRGGGVRDAETGAPIARAGSAAQIGMADIPRKPTSDVHTAIELLIAAIPNLRTLTITVDDAGEAAVDFTVREVRVVEDRSAMRLSTKPKS